MKVLIIDVDSKIDNLALMQVSAWHKSQGDEVGFHISEPDIKHCQSEAVAVNVTLNKEVI